jgi:hypothetical protein
MTQLLSDKCKHCVVMQPLQNMQCHVAAPTHNTPITILPLEHETSLPLFTWKIFPG